ncbi:MAG: cation transporter [Deltaproteobacteria bacterium]|nr:MAG: cation transporter [Deltaproteobacteria bacterium]
MSFAADAAGLREALHRRSAARLSFLGGVFVLIGKFAAFRITGSTAVYSDALESVVNVAAASLLLYSMAVAMRPADRDHPYGHGKIEFFSAGVEGTLIAVAATLILVEAARDLWRGPELRRLDLGLALVSGMAVVNAALGTYLIRAGRRTGSLALVADGKHLLTDVVTTAGVVVGLIAVYVTGYSILDPLVAIAVALHILRTGWSLARVAVGGLMDEADLATLRRIVRLFEERRRPWWIDIHSLRSWRSGSVSHVDLHLSVPRYFDADRLHEIDAEIGAVVREALGPTSDAIVHFDPCRPRQCAGCAMRDCAVRGRRFERRAAVTLADATRRDERLETGAPVEPTVAR